MKIPALRRRAFTLVEIVIALGIFTVCLISLLGLFSIGLQNSRKSGESTAIALMASQVLNTLQSQNTNVAGQSLTNYFDNDGQLTNSASTSYYTCQVNFTNAANKGITDSTLLMVQLEFLWPANVSPSPNTNLVNLTLPPAGS